MSESNLPAEPSPVTPQGETRPMRELLCAVSLFFLLGCGDMTNEQVIAATKQCEDARMRPQVVGNFWTYGIYKINCLPKEPCK